jgi:hypothetical protein
MPTRHALVRCEKSPGQFPNEYAILINLADGKRVSFFADEDLVKHDDQQDFIQVLTFDQESDADENTVLLPNEAFENGTRWAKVRRADVVLE